MVPRGDLTLDGAWSSSVPAVASVANAQQNAGHVVALSAGDTLVQGAFSTLHAEATLHVTPRGDPGARHTEFDPAPLAIDQPLVATVTFTDASVQDVTAQCAWASSALAIVEVGTSAGDAGVLHSKTVGTSNITATFDGQIGAATVAVLPVDALELAGPAAETPSVAFAAAGQIDAVWCHAFAAPGKLYLSHFDPATGWTSPEHYDTSILADRVPRESEIHRLAP